MRKIAAAVSLSAMMLFSTASNAVLHDRGRGMIFDDVLNITWLANANQAAGSAFDNGPSVFGDGPGNNDGRMFWDNAVAWAAALVHGGFDDWRLPATRQPDASCSHYASYGFGCTGSELGHMFYNNMGATAGNSILSGSNTANLALFTNLQPDVYWSGTEYAPATSHAWLLAMNNGNQGMVSKPSLYIAWAVRDGDVSPIPEPSAYVLMLVGLGVAAVVGRRRHKP